MATKKMNRDWQRVRDRIKGVWSDIDFDDANMKKTRGSLRQMVNLVHERTPSGKTGAATSSGA